MTINSDAARASIGTSGWHYRHWLGTFYPEGLRPGEMLSYYARRFCTVEVNYSFYRLPSASAVAAWRATVSDEFTFAIKASRYLTHLRRLRDPEEPVALLLERMAPLGEALGPILFQLPPRWERDGDRLAGMLAALPAGRRYAFEFRDASWFVPAVYQLLADHGAALCVYDREGQRSQLERTADFVYVRMHASAGGFEQPYSDAELADWAGTIAGWLGEGADVYVYFNNDPFGHAPRDAARLAAMLSSRVPCAAETERVAVPVDRSSSSEGAKS